jgi:predicted dehydrogenase/nucleoside-diphosphate-sugar epimerase
VVEKLLEQGFTNLRCFVRPFSRLDRLEAVLNRVGVGRNVQLVTGDLLLPDDCWRAAERVSIIYHLAAGMEKSFAGAFMNSALTTRNVMDAFLRYGKPKRFVNVSSFAVYSALSLKRGALLDESCPLEDAPQERFDAYGFGKLKQEEFVKEYGEKYKLPYVILRPGYVFGPGKTELNRRAGVGGFGFFIQVNGSNFLPLTFVDNCAEAIVLAGLKAGIDGEIFNVVDDNLPTGRQFLRAYKKKMKSFRSIRIPYFAGYGLSSAWEKYSKWSKDQLPSAYNRRRCNAEWKGNRYSNQKLKDRLGWKPRVPMDKAMETFLSQFESNGEQQPVEALKRSSVIPHTSSAPQSVKRSRAIDTQRSTSRALRVALVGCGKVADQHVHAIRRIANCEIVALCDRESLMAKQLGERFGISECFSDLKEMLRAASPDVVHITTPPESHYSLAKQCLEFGCHVYLEKPFTITAGEAECLIEFAESRHLRITAGHNYQFTLEMLEMRRLIKRGYLGGRPIHLESYWSYDLGDLRYATAFLGNQAHWVRQLPGQLLQNIISHGIAKLAEFLDDELSEIVATADQSPQLWRLAREGVLDELRVLIRDRNGTTAFFGFSTQIKGLNQLRTYGPAGSVTADIITGSLVRTSSRPYKSYLTYFVPPVKSALEQLRYARLNVVNFLRQRLYQDFGMKELIERFYNCVRTGGPPPIPYREIILTARIMDEIFAQVYGPRSQKTEVGCQTATSNKLEIGSQMFDSKGRTANHLVPAPSA